MNVEAEIRDLKRRVSDLKALAAKARSISGAPDQTVIRTYSRSGKTEQRFDQIDARFDRMDVRFEKSTAVLILSIASRELQLIRKIVGDTMREVLADRAKKP